MKLCERKGVMCEYLTDYSTCNSDNCHRKLRDIKFTSEEVRQSLEDVGIELVDGELNMEKPEFFRMLQAKDIKNFIKDIPDDARVILSDGFLTFMFDSNTLILNRYGAEWDNGVGYIDGKCCGECTHFDCLKCRKEIK